MSKMSACATLLANAPSDRVLNRFPQSYNPDASPYQSVTNFDVRVKEACLAKTAPVSSEFRVAKVILIGDPSVGKTSVITRFCQKVFNRDYKATIGVDFEVERFEILGIPFNLQIWDTAGQEKFRSIASSYYRNAHVVIVAFDISRLDTLSHCSQWFADALRVCNETVPFKFLIGNKADAITHSDYQHVEQMAVRAATEMGAEYWPLSAKTGDRVNEFFLRVTALLFNTMLQSDISIYSQTGSHSTNNVKKISSRVNLTDEGDRDKSFSSKIRFQCCS